MMVAEHAPWAGEVDAVSRTLRYKIIYLAVLVVIAIAVVVVFRHWNLRAGAAFMLAALLLIPGRIQGQYWRDFYRGRRHAQRKNYQDAALMFGRFLEQVRARPGLKRLVWLNWNVYSCDVEAMTLNHLGAVHLQMGKLDAAERALLDAADLDPLYPLPQYNLALLAKLQGDEAAADHLLAKSRALGNSAASAEILEHTSRQLALRLEGLRNAPDHPSNDVHA